MISYFFLVREIKQSLFLQLKPCNNDRCLIRFIVLEGESPGRRSKVTTVVTTESSQLDAQAETERLLTMMGIC